MARVLIIDDEPAVREAIGAMMAAAGHEICIAADGHQGLKRHRDFQPDLVITDIIMPGKEGIGTICALRKIAPTLPIIAMSGSDSGRFGGVSYLSLAGKLGADSTLSKPVSPRDLLAAVSALLPWAA